ncbi:hypothetical protein [Heyndrickxia oleronia]|nr:hypothetical protein [Heyndrickxia oleronia]
MDGDLYLLVNDAVLIILIHFHFYRGAAMIFNYMNGVIKHRIFHTK